MAQQAAGWLLAVSSWKATGQFTMVGLFLTGSYFTSWMVLEGILVLVYEYFISVVKEG